MSGNFLTAASVNFSVLLLLQSEVNTVVVVVVVTVGGLNVVAVLVG